MSVSKKLRWRRALSTLKYHYEELSFAREVSKEAAPEFEAFYRKFCAEKNVNINELDRQHKERLDAIYNRNAITDNEHEEAPSTAIGDTSMVLHKQDTPDERAEEYQMSADDIAIHEAFSKLFKRIALMIHPDKIDKNLPPDEIKRRELMFNDALSALEEKKYYILLELAEQLKISTPKNYDLQIRWMKRESESVAQEINSIKNTYNYCFGTSETDEEKEKLIRKFLHQLFRMSV